MNLRFEKLPGPIYPAYLRVGEYSIALEPELIQALKESTQLDQTRFFENLIQKVGINRYLREMIQEAVSKAEDPALLAKQLQQELQTL
ncbi:MAG: hypothetical protein EPO39_07410 [Candidatus Manganitrophaceae bacterium]|nr:MAG: hypothetical protein EPO39_07410 [Candidatus Manganitrophaceae bacterium]